MRSAIGFLIVLWGLGHFMSGAFNSLNAAASETFKLVEVVAKDSQTRLLER
jgi:hypothetical protein